MAPLGLGLVYTSKEELTGRLVWVQYIWYKVKNLAEAAKFIVSLFMLPGVTS